MSQLTLYLEPELEHHIKTAAARAGKSLSRWVGDLIREKLASDRPDRLAKLAGSWPDAPTVEEIRADEVPDLPREPF